MSNGYNFPRFILNSKLQRENEIKAEKTWAPSLSCGANPIRSGEETSIHRPKSPLQDEKGRSTGDCKPLLDILKFDKDAKLPRNDTKYDDSDSFKSATTGSTQPGSDDEGAISADEIGSGTDSISSDDEEPTTSDEEFIASDSSESSVSINDSGSETGMDSECELSKCGGKRKQNPRKTRTFYREKLLTSDPIRNGLVHIRCIDSAMVDDDSRKSKRAKLRKLCTYKGEHNNLDLKGWCFSWFSVQLRNNLCNLTLFKRLAERRKLHLDTIYDRTNSDALHDLLDDVEAKMGPSPRIGVKVSLRRTVVKRK